MVCGVIVPLQSFFVRFCLNNVDDSTHSCPRSGRRSLLNTLRFPSASFPSVQTRSLSAATSGLSTTCISGPSGRGPLQRIWFDGPFQEDKLADPRCFDMIRLAARLLKLLLSPGTRLRTNSCRAMTGFKPDRRAHLGRSRSFPADFFVFRPDFLHFDSDNR